MKAYIIRLSEFPNSIEWAKNAYESGKTHNWNIDYFEGVNGQKKSLNDYGIKKVAPIKKVEMSFQKNGVVGCFLSHYSLWKKSINLNKPICILEHDITIHKPFPVVPVNDYDVIRLAINKKAKSIKQCNIGQWWAGAMAYIITPNGAKKLINFLERNGALPADMILSANIVNTLLFEPLNTVVTFKHAADNGGFSFTQHL